MTLSNTLEVSASEASGFTETINEAAGATTPTTAVPGALTTAAIAGRQADDLHTDRFTDRGWTEFRFDGTVWIHIATQIPSTAADADYWVNGAAATQNDSTDIQGLVDAAYGATVFEVGDFVSKLLTDGNREIWEVTGVGPVAYTRRLLIAPPAVEFATHAELRASTAATRSNKLLVKIRGKDIDGDGIHGNWYQLGTLAAEGTDWPDNDATIIHTADDFVWALEPGEITPARFGANEQHGRNFSVPRTAARADNSGPALNAFFEWLTEYRFKHTGRIPYGHIVGTAETVFIDHKINFRGDGMIQGTDQVAAFPIVTIRDRNTQDSPKGVQDETTKNSWHQTTGELKVRAVRYYNTIEMWAGNADGGVTQQSASTGPLTSDAAAMNEAQDIQNCQDIAINIEGCRKGRMQVEGGFAAIGVLITGSTDQGDLDDACYDNKIEVLSARNCKWSVGIAARSGFGFTNDNDVLCGDLSYGGRLYPTGHNKVGVFCVGDINDQTSNGNVGARAISNNHFYAGRTEGNNTELEANTFNLTQFWVQTGEDNRFEDFRTDFPAWMYGAIVTEHPIYTIGGNPTDVWNPTNNRFSTADYANRQNNGRSNIFRKNNEDDSKPSQIVRLGPFRENLTYANGQALIRGTRFSSTLVDRTAQANVALNADNETVDVTANSGQGIALEVRPGTTAARTQRLQVTMQHDNAGVGVVNGSVVRFYCYDETDSLIQRTTTGVGHQRLVYVSPTYDSSEFVAGSGVSHESIALSRLTDAGVNGELWVDVPAGTFDFRFDPLVARVVIVFAQTGMRQIFASVIDAKDGRITLHDDKKNVESLNAAVDLADDNSPWLYNGYTAVLRSTNQIAEYQGNPPTGSYVLSDFGGGVVGGSISSVGTGVSLVASGLTVRSLTGPGVTLNGNEVNISGGGTHHSVYDDLELGFAATGTGNETRALADQISRTALAMERTTGDASTATGTYSTGQSFPRDMSVEIEVVQGANEDARFIFGDGTDQFAVNVNKSTGAVSSTVVSGAPVVSLLTTRTEGPRHFVNVSFYFAAQLYNNGTIQVLPSITGAGTVDWSMSIRGFFEPLNTGTGNIATLELANYQDFIVATGTQEVQMTGVGMGRAGRILLYKGSATLPTWPANVDFPQQGAPPDATSGAAGETFTLDYEVIREPGATTNQVVITYV